MADFVDTFKRRESSEGSYAEDEDDYQNQFAREEINHHSDDEERPQQGRSRPVHNQHQNNQGRKIVVNERRREAEAQQREADQRREGQEGEDKQYESDSQDKEQGEEGKGKRDVKNEKKDPTFVPKGSFYQHDTRGEDIEYAQKKNSDKLNKYKWKHDKFEKNFRDRDNGGQHQPYNKRSDREYGKRDNYQEKNPQVYYVKKGENQGKTFEEDDHQRRPQHGQRQNNNYNNNKGQYNKDRGYNKTQNQNRDPGFYEYVKKDSSKAAESTGVKQGGNKDFYVEYVPKKQETK